MFKGKKLLNSVVQRVQKGYPIQRWSGWERLGSLGEHQLHAYCESSDDCSGRVETVESFVDAVIAVLCNMME